MATMNNPNSICFIVDVVASIQPNERNGTHIASKQLEGKMGNDQAIIELCG